MTGALQGIRILDLSRVLAGPVCTQIFGDLGADVIKIEKPGAGDDTRFWGPPFLKDADGNDTTESAYYLSANRNKRSAAIDISTAQGQELLHALLEKCDVLIENFKPGSLARYGLSWEQLRARHPHLVYCAISGYGHTGPLASEPGYDFVAQAVAGLMASTGEPSGQPMKAGVAVSDVMTGLYACIGILAALRHRDATGEGQFVDLALTDCTLAAMTNIAQFYLTSGKLAPRLGNAHSTIVPYQAFEAADGHIVIAVGNDGQFRKFAGVLGAPEWADDPRFARNSARVQNRAVVVPLIAAKISALPVGAWMEKFREADIPAGPVHTMDQIFADEQILARDMKIEMDHPMSPVPVSLVGSPLKLSATPVKNNRPPPVMGAHTAEILKEILDMDDQAILSLRSKGIVS